MSICPSCTKESVPGSIYCGSCGTRLVSIPASERAADPFVGQTLGGNYLIERKIGSGGMGDVYRAVHRKLESPVAIKIIKRELLAHSAMVHRFQREARAASKLHHPNIVAVTDFGQADDGTLFMVMEYVTGSSLARLIADQAPMTEGRTVRIGAQILSALAVAHANDILHRDLKPDNVLIESRRDAPDAVKVLDFGIVKLLDADAGASTLTQAGLVCGTPGYMSPEQLRGDEGLDARSDLFSVGVVLYEMLTHKLPFDAQTPMELLHRHLTQPIAPPGQRRGRPVSAALEALVMRSLSTERDRRPESAHAMREELLRARRAAVEAEFQGDDSREGATEILPRKESPARTPAQATPAQATPAQATPAQPTPAQPTPAQATPAQATPAQATPAQATPAQATPAQATPARATPARATPARSEWTPPPETRSDLGRRTPRSQRTRSDPGTRRASGATGAERPTMAAARSTMATGRAGAHDPAVLQQIEQRVAPVLGPVATHLVARTSRAAATLDDLCRQIASFIPSSEDRRAFLAWSVAELHVSGARERTSTPRPPGTPPPVWDPAALEQARRDLAIHLGPLARIIVRRVSHRARDLTELYELLALEIPKEDDRRAFKRRAPVDVDD
jgi:serine/threonine protein kinase